MQTRKEPAEAEPSPRLSMNNGVINEDIGKHAVYGEVYLNYRSLLQRYIDDVDLSDSLLRLHDMEELLPIIGSTSNRDILEHLEAMCGPHLCYIVLRDSCGSDIHLNSIIENMKVEAEKRLRNGYGIEDHTPLQPSVGLSDEILLMHLHVADSPTLMVSQPTATVEDDIHVTNNIKVTDQEVPLMAADDDCIDDYEDHTHQKERPSKPFESTTDDDEGAFIGPHNTIPFTHITSITATLSNPADSLGSEFQYECCTSAVDNGSCSDFGAPGVILK